MKKKLEFIPSVRNVTGVVVLCHFLFVSLLVRSSLLRLIVIQ